MKKLYMIAVLLAVSAASAFSQQADLLDSAMLLNTEKEADAFIEGLDETDSFYGLYSGIALHNSSRTAADRLEEAEKLLNNCYGKTKNALALGYLGSVKTMIAGNDSAAGNLLGATARLAEGLKLIDQAVLQLPDSMHLRFLRVFNGLDVTESSPASRVDIIREDITRLKQHSASFSVSDEAMLLLAMGRLALIEEEYDSAFDYLDRAVSTAPGSPSAAQADELLWALEE